MSPLLNELLLLMFVFALQFVSCRLRTFVLQSNVACAALPTDDCPGSAVAASTDLVIVNHGRRLSIFWIPAFISSGILVGTMCVVSPGTQRQISHAGPWLISPHATWPKIHGLRCRSMAGPSLHKFRRFVTTKAGLGFRSFS